MLKPEQVRELLEYDRDTGVLRWRCRRGRVHAGSPAGSLDNKGYRTVYISGANYKAHRLAWLLVTGGWPAHQIDHRDGQKANNRWNNLREATNQQNHANRGKNKNNISGFKNVTFNPGNTKGRPWVARIMVDRKAKTLGYFASPQEASTAALTAAHQHFGEFAKGG